MAAITGMITVLFWPFPMAGAQDDGTAGHMTPVLRSSKVSGDEEKFREDRWHDDGRAGGIEELSFTKKLENDISLSFEGRVIVPDEDYLFRLRVGKRKTGYVRAEYREFRKYFDGTGGFYAPFAVAPFELNNDLHLDVGNVILEGGLTKKGIPAITLRYEHRFKEGEKSLLEWGPVNQAGTIKNIYPSFKDIDEKTDIFSLFIEHDIGRVHIEDRLHYEQFRTDTARHDKERNLTTGIAETVTVNENYSHDAFYNSLRMESYLKEKLYVSTGYLYSRLKGEGGLRITTIPFGPEPFDNNWVTRAVDVEYRSHTATLNGMLGPSSNFTLYGGLQAETADTEGDTDALLTATEPVSGTVSPGAVIKSDKDKKALEETFGIRYTGLPSTTLFAEGKWTQNEIDLFEEELEEGALAFERLTGSKRSGQRYTLGFNNSPFAGATLSLRYRRSYIDNDYDHITDTEPGYSAFITAQDFTQDELNVRFAFRPFNWLRATFTYQLRALETDTTSEAATDGSFTTGEYDAHIYSLRLAAKPAPRLQLTTLFSYRDADTTAFDNGSPSVATYGSDVFSALLTAGYGIDDKTDVSMEYLFSQSENAQKNVFEGLPLGSDYRQHGVLFTLSRQLSETIRTRLQYGYYKYEAEEKGDADDYNAHVFVLGLTYNF
jgi:hypothetical protein